MNPTDSLVGLEPEVDAHIRGILDRAAAVRLPELFKSRPPEALYWVGDRHGVSTVALRTTSLTAEQVVAIMTFRLAQYLLAHQLDPRLIHAKGLTREAETNVSPRDVHILSAASASGELLNYVTFEACAEEAASKTMATTDRPLFPVETVFGRGIFNRLGVIRDLPMGRICELGRYMKNHSRPPLDEVASRGTVELSLALCVLLHVSLRADIDVAIGDIEEGVAKRNLDFFHVPLVVLHGVIPFVAEGSFGFFNYQHRTRYPFACLCSDISTSRLDAIGRALELPGKEALVALLDMRKDPVPIRSSLEPAGGVPQLSDTPVPQEGVPMATRRQLLDVGDWLRTTTLFRDLSVAEAAVLGTFLDRVTYEPDTFVVRQGDPGDDVYLIEYGTADAKLTTPDGRYLKVRELGPRDYFGEIALIAGGERTADVIATTPLTLLRLSRDAYERYLARLIEVERDLTRTALTRSHDTLRTIGRERP